MAEEQKAESIRDILKRMAQNKISQTSPQTSPNIKAKQIAVPKPVPVPQETEDEFEELTDEEMADDDEKPVETPKVEVKQDQRSQDMANIIEKIRDLQDNGIYRLEQLSVLNEINASLKEFVNLFKQ